MAFLLWTAACTIPEYKRFIFLKYGGYRKSADRNSGCVVCLMEEKLKEVCSLKITLPPESKGGLVFIRALNKYLETEELDEDEMRLDEKLKGLAASLKQNAPKEKTEPLEALDDKKATVKTEQKPAVSISKFKRDFKVSGQIGDVSRKDGLSFSSLVHQIENGLRNDYTGYEIKEAVIKAINPEISLRSYLGAGVEQGLE